MSPVNVGVSHNDDVAVPELGDFELIADAGAHGYDKVLDLVVAQHAVKPGPLNVENFTTERQDGLEF